MGFNKEEIFDYIRDELDKRSVKYSIHKFENATMIDIWIRDVFYVVQIESGFIGLSKVDDHNPGFDTIPDKSFTNKADFMDKFAVIFK